MATVEVRNIEKRFGSVSVLKQIDCAFADGEFIVILGPSGCGKSTLLRIIAGLERQSSGDVMIGARVVNDVEPAERDIAMVFQTYALYPHMSVEDNMSYGLKVRGMAKSEIAARVAKAAGMLELSSLLKRRPRELSGGQRQRVAMGRAIVRDPQVFLFDEPLSNLDAKLRVQMRVEIKKLHQAIQVTSVYVTHDQVEAMTLADRIVVMNAGRIEQVGTPLDVYQRPASVFVAGFLGAPAMNMIAVGIGEDGRTLRLGDGNVGLGLDQPAWGKMREGVLGVRPEALQAGPGSEPGLIWVSDVRLVEPLGAESLVHLVIPGGHDVVMRVNGVAEYVPGAKITVHAPFDALHRFARDSGRRLGV